MNRRSQWAKRWLALAPALLLWGCAHQPAKSRDIPPLDGHQPVSVARQDLLQTSDGMRLFVQRNIPAELNEKARAHALKEALFNPLLFPFEYDPLLTLSSPEAFRELRGNCLSYSAMLVALAREAGLEAWYQQVDIPPDWESQDETLLVGIHVNAVVSWGSGHYTLDVSNTRTREFFDRRRLDDPAAQAHFYNNKAVDALMTADLPLAHAWLGLALEVDPAFANAWSNLGVVYRRNEQYEAAILAYAAAMDIDPGLGSAASNLHALYMEIGDEASASRLQARVNRHRKDNPWHLAAMSQEAAESGDHATAVKLLQRAIRLESREYRLHLALARSLEQVGKPRQAGRSYARARELAPDAPEFSEREDGTPLLAEQSPSGAPP